MFEDREIKTFLEACFRTNGRGRELYDIACFDSIQSSFKGKYFSLHVNVETTGLKRSSSIWSAYRGVFS